MESLPNLPHPTPTVTDHLGRILSFRRLGPLDRLRLFEAAGAELSRNDRWLGVALLASSATAIDGVPYPFPNNKSAIEAMVQRLGDAGHQALARALAPEPPADRATAGN
jgi:hypothetical protein